jgi:hypothetical protein
MSLLRKLSFENGEEERLCPCDSIATRANGVGQTRCRTSEDSRLFHAVIMFAEVLIEYQKALSRVLFRYREEREEAKRCTAVFS